MTLWHPTTEYTGFTWRLVSSANSKLNPQGPHHHKLFEASGKLRMRRPSNPCANVGNAYSPLRTEDSTSTTLQLQHVKTEDTGAFRKGTFILQKPHTLHSRH